jgi:uncharacterized protein (TIGR02466 family)
MNNVNKSMIMPLFPEAIIYGTTIDVDKNEIINHISKLEFKETRNSELNADATKCYITKDLNVLKDLNFLQNKIDEHVKIYLYGILKYQMDHKWCNSWFSKTKPGGISHKHMHSNTFLTGVYYPIGNENFKITFHKKEEYTWCIETNESNEYNSKYITFNIKDDNTLFIFPSWLNHQIAKNTSNVDRYSLAFNINPKGFIGISDSRVYF